MKTETAQQVPATHAAIPCSFQFLSSCRPVTLTQPRFFQVDSSSRKQLHVHISRAALPPTHWHWAMTARPQPCRQPPALSQERSPKSLLLSLLGVNGLRLHHFGTRTLTPPISFFPVEQLKGHRWGQGQQSRRPKRANCEHSGQPGHPSRSHHCPHHYFCQEPDPPLSPHRSLYLLVSKERALGPAKP